MRRVTARERCGLVLFRFSFGGEDGRPHSATKLFPARGLPERISYALEMVIYGQFAMRRVSWSLQAVRARDGHFHW